jgi:hypothetical protein
LTDGTTTTVSAASAILVIGANIFCVVCLFKSILVITECLIQALNVTENFIHIDLLRLRLFLLLLRGNRISRL